MLLYVQYNVQITSRATEWPGFAQSRKTNSSFVFHSGGNFCVHGPLPQHPAVPFAFGTWIGDHAARALAGRAGTGHAEETLLITHLATASTRAAGHRSFAGSAS